MANVIWGSSVNLGRRFREYLNIKYLERTTSMPICSALFKYGYSNFSLAILKYSEPSVLLERENHYFKFLKPEYNILKTAGSLLGFKHSEETRIKFRARKYSEETKAKLSASMMGNSN